MIPRGNQTCKIPALTATIETWHVPCSDDRRTDESRRRRLHFLAQSLPGQFPVTAFSSCMDLEKDSSRGRWESDKTGEEITYLYVYIYIQIYIYIYTSCIYIYTNIHI